MTQQQNNLSRKTGWIITLITVFVLSFTMLFAVACGDSNKKSDDKRDKYNVSTEEKDELAIANGTFEFGTADVKTSDYPYATGISWTKTNTNASSSTRNSGIISTADDAYDVLLEKLYAADVSDSDYPADSELTKAEWRLQQLKLKHPNPGVREGAKDGDKKILMIYNYNATEGKGTAQKFTSATAVNLKANAYGKISVWVKTVDLKSRAQDSEFGANINVTNTLNGVTQDQLRIKNINTNGEWTQYVIYVKGSDSLPVTLKVVLGLGYPNGGSNREQEYVEGQAFFDDVTYEEITKEDYESATAIETKNSSFLAVASTDTIDLASTALTVKFNFDVAPHNPATLTGATAITDADVPAISGKDGYEVTLNGETVTKDLFTATVPANGFYFLSFYVKTNLNLTATGVNVFVVDQGTSSATEKDYINSKQFTNVRTEKVKDDVYGSWVKYSILVKNNFKESPADDRTFTVKAIIGPIDENNVSDSLINPTGTVYFANFEEVTGNIKDADDNNTEEYSMAASLATGTNGATVTLISPKSSDYTEDKDDEKSYPFSPVYTEKDDIKTAPVKAKSLYSMSLNADGDYVYGAKNDNVVNGIINTEYLASYADANLATYFAGREADVEYQPVMINNKTASSFGYYYSSSDMTVAASTVKKITVQVKVVGDAKAYIYLVKKDKATGESVLNAKDFNSTVADNLKNDVYTVVSDTSAEEGDFKTITFYISAGKTAYDFRIELWNGSRDGANKSTGYVFFNSVTVATSSLADVQAVTDAFEADNAIDVDNVEGYPENYVRYTQQLNKYEIKFNKTAKKDDKISYESSVVYLKDDDTLVARYDTIAPVENDPNEKKDDNTDTDTDHDHNKTEKVNSATFWLSFSSILLAVLIVVVIVYILVKKLVRKSKAKKSGAVQSYDVHSRARAMKHAKSKAEKVAPVEKTDDTDTDVDDAEEVTETEEEYTYGEVQSFDDEAKDTEKEIAEVTGEQPDDDGENA